MLAYELLDKDLTESIDIDDRDAILDLPLEILPSVGGGCHVCHQLRIDK